MWPRPSRRKSSSRSYLALRLPGAPDDSMKCPNAANPLAMKKLSAYIFEILPANDKGT